MTPIQTLDASRYINYELALADVLNHMNDRDLKDGSDHANIFTYTSMVAHTVQAVNKSSGEISSALTLQGRPQISHSFIHSKRKRTTCYFGTKKRGMM